MSRRLTSIVVIAVALAVTLFFAPDVVLIVFAGILLAVLLHSGGAWTGARLGIAEHWGIGLFVIGLVLAVAGFGVAVAPAIVDEAGELSRRLPEALDALRQRVAEYPGGRVVRDRLTPEVFE